MTLSNSRQQFLAYESQGPEEIQYERKGGTFVSTCVCIGFIFLAIVMAILVGVIVYFITYFKLSQKSEEFWNEEEPFGHIGPPSPDLRLPSDVIPSFYRIKLRTDIENSKFDGDVYITVRANKRTKEIILHSKDLIIRDNVRLTEQIYETVETLHTKGKRDVGYTTLNSNNTIKADNVTVESSSNNENVTTASSSSTENITTGSHINKDISIESTNIINNSNITTESSNTTKDNLNTTAVPVHKTTMNKITDGIPPTTELTAELTPLEPIETHVTHSNVRNIKILSVSESTGDRLILTLAMPLKPGVDYTLEISFEGNISNSLTGFYKSSYRTSDNVVKRLGVTQFQPTSARAAFPCFDEPNFKAKFEISIAHPLNYSVLSNMNVAGQEIIPEQQGWQWTHFERSVNMSTYLVAYIISDFKSLETSYISKDGVTKPIRIWSRPEMISKAKYALTITPKLLNLYEDVFGVPYALDKLDLVAVPDFSSGAMENWGLITFRETTLLFDDQTSGPRDKQNVAIDIAHELAHQWFGNLVTMKWWTDLWLNEGFATFIEYLGVDYIEPEWNMFESFSRDKMDLLRSDALKNTSPVSRKVIDASEISQKFDEISYTKGANLIRMLNHTISEELFRKGLVIYLEEWQYSNAEENDLWQAMSKAISTDDQMKDLSVVNYMNSWTRQAGYPLLEVHRNYGNGDVLFRQKLFTSSSEPYPDMASQLWHIPISYTSMRSPATEWSTKPKLWLKDKSVISHLDINGTEALYVNVDAIGYYRVNYDQRNWELLSDALRVGHFKSPMTKAQLIDDAFNLAKYSQLNYSYALGLTTCVIDGEDSKTVWDLLLNNMAFLKYNLRATSGFVHFQDYVKILLNKQLKKLNYGLSTPKDDNEAFLIENLVMWECIVESPRCLNWCKEQFEAWIRQPDPNNNPIPRYLRSLVYSIALKYGGRREFEFLWNAFQNSTDPNVKSLIVNILTSTRDESLITMLLEKSLNEIPKQYAVSVWNTEPPVGTRIAQDFLINNFERVYDTFTSMDSFMFQSVLNGAFGSITDTNDLDRLKSFAIKHKEKLLPMSQSLQKMVDAALLRIEWMKTHAQTINTWFKEYVKNHNQKEIASTSTEAQTLDFPKTPAPIITNNTSDSPTISTPETTTQDSVTNTTTT